MTKMGEQKILSPDLRPERQQASQPGFQPVSELSLNLARDLLDQNNTDELWKVAHDSLGRALDALTERFIQGHESYPDSGLKEFWTESAGYIQYLDREEVEQLVRTAIVVAFRNSRLASNPGFLIDLASKGGELGAIDHSYQRLLNDFRSDVKDLVEERLEEAKAERISRSFILSGVEGIYKSLTEAQKEKLHTLIGVDPIHDDGTPYYKIFGELDLASEQQQKLDELIEVFQNLDLPNKNFKTSDQIKQFISGMLTMVVYPAKAEGSHRRKVFTFDPYFHLSDEDREKLLGDTNQTVEDVNEVEIEARDNYNNTLKGLKGMYITLCGQLTTSQRQSGSELQQLMDEQLQGENSDFRIVNYLDSYLIHSQEDLEQQLESKLEKQKRKKGNRIDPLDYYQNQRAA